MDKICNVSVSLPSAPDLILDLLVADGGTLSSQALCRAGALLGIGETTMRVGLTRLGAGRDLHGRARQSARLQPLLRRE